jgi:hypothetical protein
MQLQVKSPRKISDGKSRRNLKKPFVLKFLTYRKGVLSATTTGTINDIDSGDNT